MPEIPLYRVHRAIALHELGREENAREQAAIALSLIRAHGLTATDEMQLLDRGLEHVQGPSRLWLSRELELNGKPPVAKNRQAAR